jgi:hypothetical protein
VRAGRAAREAKGGELGGGGGGELGGCAEKAPLRLVRKREADRERSMPPNNVEERK